MKWGTFLKYKMYYIIVKFIFKCDEDNYNCFNYKNFYIIV